MTAAEFTACSSMPASLGWMACHFSPYGARLSNIPSALPAGSLLILNDRIPICGHDPALIADQLAGAVHALHCSRVLLDFQRPGNPETAAVIEACLAALPCPAAVSECYAQGLACPIFLPPLPLTKPLSAYLAPWQGREIWLEAANQTQTVTVSRSGSVFSSQFETDGGPYPHADTPLHCRYRMELTEDSARFILHRDKAELEDLLEDAAGFGVTAAVGLWQEFN